MAFAVVYFAPANANLFSPPTPTPTSRQPTFFTSTSDFSAAASSSSSSSSSLSSHKPMRNDKTICASKRDLNLSLVAAVIFSAPLPASSIATMYEDLELERYTDSKEGFTLLRPSSWIKVDKAGANVLFEEASKGANSVGVVVTPVRLTSLREFGSSQFVAEKLVQAEKRKESTKDAEVISVTERSGQGGLQVYEFEYKVDSTRGGMKRIFSAAFVAAKKLYLLNIAYTDKPESPLDTNKRMILEKVLHSFDAAPLA